MEISGSRASRSERAADAKALRWEHAWCVGGTRGGWCDWSREREGRESGPRSLWAMVRALTFTLGELDARGGF